MSRQGRAIARGRRQRTPGSRQRTGQPTHPGSYESWPTSVSVDRRPGVGNYGRRGVIHPSEIDFLQLKRTDAGFHDELLAVRRESIFFNHGRTELRPDIDDVLLRIPARCLVGGTGLGRNDTVSAGRVASREVSIVEWHLLRALPDRQVVASIQDISQSMHS